MASILRLAPSTCLLLALLACAPSSAAHAQAQGASHVVMISKPKEVAAVILTAATSPRLTATASK